ncbi:MAG: hypothetical protein ACJA0H_002409 [Francisellaceae bacterium]|jgi:hypothetical protein
MILITDPCPANIVELKQKILDPYEMKINSKGNSGVRSSGGGSGGLQASSGLKSRPIRGYDIIKENYVFNVCGDLIVEIRPGCPILLGYVVLPETQELQRRWWWKSRSSGTWRAGLRITEKN